MLTMTLRVLASQARYIRGDARLLFAFLEGIRIWRRQYGRQLASELAHSFSTRQRHHRRRKLLLLLNHYPQGLMMILLLRIMPDLSKRKALISQQATAKEASLLDLAHTWLNASKPASPSRIG